MANIKLGDNTLTNVNQIKVKNADDLTQTVTFTEGSGSTYTAGIGIDITDNVISSTVPTIVIAPSQILEDYEDAVIAAKLTDEQIQIVKSKQVDMICFDLSQLDMPYQMYVKKEVDIEDEDYYVIYGSTGFETEKYTVVISDNDELEEQVITVVALYLDEGCIRCDYSQNLSDYEKYQARKNQGLYYTRDKYSYVSWDGNTTDKRTLTVPIYDYTFTEATAYKVSNYVYWFDPDATNMKYSVKFNGYTKTLYSSDTPPSSEDISTIQYAYIPQSGEPTLHSYQAHTVNLNEDYSYGFNMYWTMNKRFIRSNGQTQNKFILSNECEYFIDNEKLDYAIGDQSLLLNEGIFYTKYEENNYLSKIEVDTLDTTKNNIYDIQFWIPVNESGEVYYIGFGNVKVASSSIPKWWPQGYTTICAPLVTCYLQSANQENIGTYLFLEEGNLDGVLNCYGMGYVSNVYKQEIETVPIINEEKIIGHFQSPYSWGFYSGTLCDLDFDKAKEAFLAGKEVILFGDGLMQSQARTGILDGTIVPSTIKYVATEYIPYAQGTTYYMGDRYLKAEQLRFVAIGYDNIYYSGTNKYMGYGAKVFCTSYLYCKGIDLDEDWKDMLISSDLNGSTLIGTNRSQINEGFPNSEWLQRYTEYSGDGGEGGWNIIMNSIRDGVNLHAIDYGSDPGAENCYINTNALGSYKIVLDGLKFNYYEPSITSYYNNKIIDGPNIVDPDNMTLNETINYLRPQIYMDMIMKVDDCSKEFTEDDRTYIKRFRTPVPRAPYMHSIHITSGSDHILFDTRSTQNSSLDINQIKILLHQGYEQKLKTATGIITRDNQLYTIVGIRCELSDNTIYIAVNALQDGGTALKEFALDITSLTITDTIIC